jgi:hypothetical protein
MTVAPKLVSDLDPNLDRTRYQSRELGGAVVLPSNAELRERKEFAYEAAVRMRDRFLQQEVWERMGVPVREAMQIVSRSPDRQLFQKMLFAKIVPNCKKLGLLDNGDTWLRERFTELGVIDFEDLQDTGEEMESFQLT